MHVVDRCVGCRCRAGGAASFDHLRAALLHAADELILEPDVVIDHIGGRLATDRRVTDVGVLGRRMVAPDDHPLDLRDGHPGLACELRDRAVVVKPHHCRKAFGRNVGRVAHRNKCIRVCRVTDDKNADVVGGVVVDRLALRREDSTVRLKQVAALHPLRARARADEEGDVGAIERLIGLVADLNPAEQRKGTVEQFHRRSFSGAERRRDLEQTKLNWAVRTEQLA